MIKSKKLISILLSLALLASSIFVAGAVTSADLDSLDSITNTYDDETAKDGLLQLNSGIYMNSEAGTKVYTRSSTSDEFAETTYPYLSVSGAQVEEEAEGNKAVHFTLAKSSIWLPVVRIYQPDTANLTHFKATANTTYEIKFRYKVDAVPTDSLKIQLIRTKWPNEIEKQNYQYGGVGDTTDPVLVPELVYIDNVTNGWVDVRTTFTMPETDHYLTLGLASNSYVDADVWVDDVVVSECINITAHNYDAASDKAIPVSKNTTIADIEIPEVAGYRFCGIYADAEYATKLDTDLQAGLYSDLFFKWEPLTLGQFYCGFEDYKPQSTAMSYNTDVVTIGGEATYVGSKALKATLKANGLTAFELRDDAAFEIVAGTQYTLSFAYKANTDVEIYAGVGKAGDVPGTAEALAGIKATGDGTWRTETLTVTPDKGTADGYAIAMLLYAENEAEIFIDDVLVSGPEQGYENPEITTNFDNSWYPVLALFEGIELPDPPEIWDGSAEAPEDPDNDGVYEITKPSQLAYVIANGGGAGNTYKLLNDIYLNELDKIDWTDGTVTDGYTAQQWYRTTSWGWEGYGGRYNGHSITAFQGTIDGDGHTIYGLYFNSNGKYDSNDPAGYATGLLPNAATGTVIKNLGIDKAYIDSYYGASAFVGRGNSGGSVVIDGCYVGENVQLKGTSVGVFRHWDSDCPTTITNCYSLANVTTTTETGMFGLTTSVWGKLIIENSYNAFGPITSNTDPTSVTITNCYETVSSGYDYSGAETIDAEKMKGTEVFINSDQMPNLNTDRAYIATVGYPKLAVHEGIEVPEIWDGSKDTAPAKNDESGAYEITNGAELAYAIYNGGTVGEETNCTFVLTKDIYLNDIDAINWKTGEVLVDGYSPRYWFKNWSWNMNGANPGTNRKSDFKGTIDGNGHTVYGIYYKSNATSYAESLGYAVALIPSVPAGGTATVTNLGVDNIYINSEYSAAAIIGKVGSNGDAAATVNISNSYVGSNVYIKGYNAAALCGNSFYKYATRTISNCYSLATTTSGGGNSGLISNVPYVNMSNCYNANGPITTNTYDSSASFSNCYETVVCGFAGVTTISNTLMQGLDVFEDGKMPNLNADGVFTATTGYPELTIFMDEVITDTEEDNEEVAPEIWGGKTDLSKPVLNADGIYEITNGAELAWTVVNNGKVDGTAAKFILTNDIYLNNINEINWSTGAVNTGYTVNTWWNTYSDYKDADDVTTNLAFEGSIDGDGHTIYGLYYKTDNPTSGGGNFATALIPQVADGANVEIKNLGLDYSFVYYEGYASGFVGVLGNSSTTLSFTDCYAGDNLHVKGSHTSAFRGFSNGGTTNITNCYSRATYEPYKSTVQGLVSTASGTVNIKNTYTTDAVSTNTSNNGKITATNVYEGVSSGYTISGVTTYTDHANMKGDDVLTKSSKMLGLASANAFVPTYLDFADHDYYIYLPAGTVFTKDLQPTFYDTFFMSVAKDDILLANTMVSGAYVKFAVEPTAEDIKVPTALADFVHQGTLAEINAMDYQTEYYGIQSEIVSQQLDKQSDDAVNYIFITDIHYNGENTETSQIGAALLKQMQLVTKIANEDASIDFIAVGGDIIEGTNTKANAISYIQTILAPLADSTKPVFVMSGNHDDNSYGSWAAYIGETNFEAGYSDDSYFAKDKLISKYEWDTSVIDAFVTDGIVQPSIDGVPQRYYYYDLEKGGKTTRIFCLDAIDYAVGSYNEDGSINELVLEDGKSEWTTAPDAGTDLQYTYKMGASEYTYSDAQIEWLEASLKAGGYDDVIFLSHMGIDAETGGVSTNGDKLRTVISDFNNKTGNLADTDGKILSYQFGHIHAERELYSADIDLWQLCTSTAKAEQAGESGAPWRALSYSYGTESEACFDVMSVSRQSVVKFGIGAATSHSLVSYLKLPAGDVNTDETADICDLVQLHNIANSTAKTTTVDVDKDNVFTVAVDAAALRKLLIGAN